MIINFGYELSYWTPLPTHMILMLHSQPGVGQRLIKPDILTVDPAVALRFYVDSYGNTCTRLELPGGYARITADALLEDSGEPEPEVWSAQEH